MRIGVLLFALVLFSTSSVITTMQKKAAGNRQPDQPSSFSEEIPTVSFCDLLAHSELYKDRVVRVRAVYVANFESSVLYDARCTSKENRVWFTLECNTDGSCKTLRERL